MGAQEAATSLGREITRLANEGKIDGARDLFYLRYNLAQRLLTAVHRGNLDEAIKLGTELSAPIFGGPAMGKDWRPVAELAWKLGRQVARGEQGQREAA